VRELHQIARRRVEELHARGETDAYLYGAESTKDYSALNAFFLLKDRPAVYNLPEEPKRPVAVIKRNYLFSFGAAIGLAAASALLFVKGD
jgi:formate dehydrogenase iron-sulfur subunit